MEHEFIDVENLSEETDWSNYFVPKWVRLINYIIDNIICYIIFLTFQVAYIVNNRNDFDLNPGGPMTFTLEQQMIFFAMAMGVLTIYYGLTETVFQRSLGKFMTGTKVITTEGSRPNPGVILKRTLCRLIPFDNFSFLVELNKGWHDSLSGTLVVKKSFPEKY